jgi:hypothetical protein
VGACTGCARHYDTPLISRGIRKKAAKLFVDLNTLGLAQLAF